MSRGDWPGDAEKLIDNLEDDKAYLEKSLLSAQKELARLLMEYNQANEDKFKFQSLLEFLLTIISFNEKKWLQKVSQVKVDSVISGRGVKGMSDDIERIMREFYKERDDGT